MPLLYIGPYYFLISKKEALKECAFIRHACLTTSINPQILFICIPDNHSVKWNLCLFKNYKCPVWNQSMIKSILPPEASRPFGEKQFQKSIDNLAVCPPKTEVFILIIIHLRR